MKPNQLKRMIKACLVCLMHGINPLGSPYQLEKKRDKLSDKEKHIIVEGCMSSIGQLMIMNSLGMDSEK